MTIRFTGGAPTNTHEKLGSWVDELRHPDKADAPLPSIGEGYEVRYLPVEEIAVGKLIDAAHTSRWRHLVAHDGRPHGELELDESLDPVALHQGPGKDGLSTALKRANELSEDFEAVVVMAPPLRFVGLWLHGAQSDLIMPYAPNDTDLANYVAVSVDDALEILQPMAVAVLEASAESDETGG